MSRVLLGLMLAVGLAACGKKVEEKIPEKVEAAPVVKEEATQEQKLAAMVRPYDRLVRACADGLRNNSFFVLFKAPPDGQTEGLFVGWYLIENVEFYKTSNNTWFITELPDKDFVKVYPDVTGLACKEKDATTP